MFTAYSLYGNEQQAIYAPLNPQDLESASNQQEGSCFLLSAEFWCYVFQIVFQVHQLFISFDFFFLKRTRYIFRMFS